MRQFLPIDPHMRRERTTRACLTLLVALLVAGAAAPGAADVPVGLQVTKSGTGHGTVTSDVVGIDCGATCQVEFGLGQVVILTATPRADATFIGWTGACTGEDATCQLTMDVAKSVNARFDRSYRPDAWIKLCGLSDGCTINPLPHPWKGRDIYNDTGTRQRISVRMEDGEGVRYWMIFENDGVLADTLIIDGCAGTPKFKVNKVQIGFYKRPQAGVTLITEQFKNGTAKFDVGPDADNDRIKLTLNIVAPTTAEGVTYHCPITVRSQGDPDAVDTLDTVMTTY